MPSVKLFWYLTKIVLFLNNRNYLYYRPSIIKNYYHLNCCFYWLCKYKNDVYRWIIIDLNVNFRFKLSEMSCFLMFFWYFASRCFTLFQTKSKESQHGCEWINTVLKQIGGPQVNLVSVQDNKKLTSVSKPCIILLTSYYKVRIPILIFIAGYLYLNETSWLLSENIVVCNKSQQRFFDALHELGFTQCINNLLPILEEENLTYFLQIMTAWSQISIFYLKISVANIAYPHWRDLKN